MITRASIVLSLAFVGGCWTPPSAEVNRHIVMFGRDGMPIDAAAKLWLPSVAPFPDLSREDWNEHQREVLDGIGAKRPDGRPYDSVLLFIHGGLNTQVDSIERAKRYACEIACSGRYPIFVNWKASLVSCYLERLLFLRQGKDKGWAVAWLSPFVLAADLVHTVARTPIVLGSEILEFLRGTFELDSTDTFTARATMNQLLRAQDPMHPSSTVSPAMAGSDERGPMAEAWSVVSWLATSPVKLASSVVIDGLGAPAWHVLERHTQVLFAPEPDYRAGGTLPPFDAPLPGFIERLRQNEAARIPGDGDLGVTLIAHSMGTIVASELLRRETERLHAASGGPSADRRALYHDVVYMGAACSIKQFLVTAIPYLHANPKGRVHVLMLDPTAEANESNGFDLAPRGSLLQWLDDFLTDPTDLLERRLGKAKNLLLAYHEVPTELRGRLSIRSFRYTCNRDRRREQPETHGSFDDVERWWSPEFWDVSQQGR